MKSYKNNINTNWILKQKATTTRWAKLYQSDFKEEINDKITLLNRLKGLKKLNAFETCMYRYIYIIKKGV